MRTRCLGLGAAGALWVWLACAHAKPADPPVRAAAPADPRDGPLACATWVYGGTKGAVCFSSKFLAIAAGETYVEAEETFTSVPLADATVFEYPFAIMTGEGAFTLSAQERQQMKAYLEGGGFLLASAGCSSKEWARCFLTEFKQTFPDVELKDIPMSHPMFRAYHSIPSVVLRKGGTTLLKGMEANGRMVLVYTPEGLNDTASVSGCCCCGGNEIQNSKEVNLNLFIYSLMH